jgi:CHAT domain-containing protein
MAKYKKAESYFLTARKKWQKEPGPDHPYFISNSEELARLYWKTNATIKANNLFAGVVQSKYKQLNKIFRFTSEKEKQLYLKNIAGANDSYQSFCFEKISHNLAGQPYSMSLLYRNLILSSAQELRQIIHNSRDTLLAKNYTEWLTVKRQLANLYAQGSEANLLTVKELEGEADNIEKALARSSAAFGKIQKRTTWQDIRKGLKDNEAAIEFIDFRLSNADRATDSIEYAALVLKKTLAQPLLVPLFEKKRLDTLLEQSSNDEAGAINKLYSSQDLFTILWKPVEKYLGGISKVYYAPSGNLFRISFGAILLNDKKVLSDKYRLVQLNTTETVASQDQDFITASDNIQLYGGIDYDADTTALKKAVEGYSNQGASRSLPDDLTRGSSFRYLPGTKEEIDEIKKQADKAGVKVTLLSGVNATKESFLCLNDMLSPAILHIATHGFFFDEPGNDSSAAMKRKFETSGKVFRESENPLFRMGLLFAGGNNIWRGRIAKNVGNGIVTAYEISSSMYLPNTKLVVLSACETARGHIDGSEGVYGLQRAFKIAGAQNLVMSLWKVPDAETSEFMQAFYRNIFNRQSISDAFYNARDTMKIKYRNDPYKWAAWVLVR